MSCVSTIEVRNKCFKFTSQNVLATVNLDPPHNIVVHDENTTHIMRNHVAGFRQIALSPAAPLLAMLRGPRSYKVYVWDYVAKARVAVLRGHTYVVSTIVFSPDGRLLASGSYDCTIRLWRTDDWTAPPTVLQHDSPGVDGILFSQCSRLMASHTSGSMLYMWRCTPQFEFADSLFVRGMAVAAFQPQGHLLAAGGYGTIRIIEVNGLNELRALRNHLGHVSCLAFSPSGQQLASGAADSVVCLWDVATGVCTHMLQNPSAIQDVAYTSQGNQLMTATYKGVVRMWTVCPWSDRTHRLFDQNTKRTVFQLMCVRAWLTANSKMNLPIELWLMVMEYVKARPVVPPFEY